MVMMWAALTADGRSSLVFIDRGIKINGEYYHENILERALKPWAGKDFGHRLWTCQGLSIIALSRCHPSMVKNSVPRLISAAQCPPKSPNANLLDYCSCAILKIKVGTKKYQRVDHLKKPLRRQWHKIPQSHFRAGFMDTLKAIIRAKGG